MHTRHPWASAQRPWHTLHWGCGDEGPGPRPGPGQVGFPWDPAPWPSHGHAAVCAPKSRLPRALRSSLQDPPQTSPALSPSKAPLPTQSLPQKQSWAVSRRGHPAHALCPVPFALRPCGMRRRQHLSCPSASLLPQGPDWASGRPHGPSGLPGSCRREVPCVLVPRAHGVHRARQGKAGGRTPRLGENAGSSSSCTERLRTRSRQPLRCGV